MNDRVRHDCRGLGDRLSKRNGTAGVISNMAGIGSGCEVTQCVAGSARHPGISVRGGPVNDADAGHSGIGPVTHYICFGGHSVCNLKGLCDGHGRRIKAAIMVCKIAGIGSGSQVGWSRNY